MRRRVLGLALLAVFCLASCDCGEDAGFDEEQRFADDDNDNNNDHGDDDDDNDDNDDDNNDDDDDDDDDSCDCLIDEECYEHREPAPDNPCLVCDAFLDPAAWSFNDGAACDDGAFCNGADFCLSGDCAQHVGDPCADDGLYCNGAESCDEESDECAHAGNPCLPPDSWCQEDGDACLPADTCAAVADQAINACGATLLDANGEPQDVAGLTTWCQLSEALFAPGDELLSPFWTCWRDCAFWQDCTYGCFLDCLRPPDPGAGCAGTVHDIYDCGVTFPFLDRPEYYVLEMDAAALCDEWSRAWDCYEGCLDYIACDDPPAPQQTLYLTGCIHSCDPSPALEFNAPDEWAYVDYDPAFDLQEFTVECWFAVQESKADAAGEYPLVSRENTEADGRDAVYGWQLGLTVSAAVDASKTAEFYPYFRMANPDGAWPIAIAYRPVYAGDWYYLAAKFDGAQIALYVDGDWADTVAYAGSAHYDDAGLGIGRNAGDAASVFYGKVDEVRLSDTARDIFFAYAYEHEVDEETVGLWPMNESSGTVIVDAAAGRDGWVSQDLLWTTRLSRKDWLAYCAHNAIAQTTGTAGAIAEEGAYQSLNTYLDSLEELLEWDHNLTGDPLVTFWFGTCNTSGYTFTTRHALGDKSLRFAN